MGGREPEASVDPVQPLHYVIRQNLARIAHRASHLRMGRISAQHPCRGEMFTPALAASTHWPAAAAAAAAAASRAERSRWPGGTRSGRAEPHTATTRQPPSLGGPGGLGNTYSHPAVREGRRLPIYIRQIEQAAAPAASPREAAALSETQQKLPGTRPAQLGRPQSHKGQAQAPNGYSVVCRTKKKNYAHSSMTRETRPERYSRGKLWVVLGRARVSHRK